MSGARGGRQGAAAARKLPSGGSSSGSQVFVSLPDLYRVGPSSAVSNEDIFKLLSEPVPAVDALFMNREKYEFTINSAELHKSKSGEPMVAVYEGLPYVISGRAVGPVRADKVVYCDVFAVLPTHSDVGDHATMRILALDIDRSASHGVLSCEQCGPHGLRIAWLPKDGFELCVKLHNAALRHGKSITLALQVDVFGSQQPSALSITRATCTVRLIKDYIEKRSMDRRKGGAASAPYTLFASRPPLGPSARQQQSMQLQHTRTAAAGQQQTAAIDSTGNGASSSSAAWQIPADTNQRPRSAVVGGESAYGSAPSARANMPEMTGRRMGSSGDIPVSYSAHTTPIDEFDDPMVASEAYDAPGDLAGAVAEPVVPRLYWRSNSLRDVRELAFLQSSVLLGRATDAYGNIGGVGLNASPLGSDPLDTDSAEAGRRAKGEGQQGMVSVEDVESMQRNMDALNLSCANSGSTGDVSITGEEGAPMPNLSASAHLQLLRGAGSSQHTIHSSQPSTYESVHVFRGFADPLGSSRSGHRGVRSARFKVKRVESCGARNRAKGPH